MTPAPSHLGRLALVASLCVCLGATSVASAQWSDEFAQPVATPEHFTGEFRVGTYVPDVGNSSFRDVFGGDRGPLLALELNAFVYRIPYVGPLGVALNLGWAKYTGSACPVGTTNCEGSDEGAKFVLFPVAALATLRVDVLARELNIPFVFTGKIGLDSVFFRSKRGGSTEAEGRSHGLRWAAQVALELDWIRPRAARSLDVDWGINHSYLFFELYGSTASSSLPLGDTTWAAGLGLVF